MIIINHVKLVQDYGPQLRDGRIFNSGIDEHIRLGTEKEVRSLNCVFPARYRTQTFSRVHMAISKSCHEDLILPPPKKPTTLMES